MIEKKGEFMKIKLALCAFLAGNLIFASGCTQSVVSYHQAEKKYFDNIKTTAESVISENEQALSAPLQADIDLSLPEEGFSDISLHIDNITEDENAYGILKIGVNEYDINVEYWINEAESKAFALLPDISEIYALFDYSEYLPEQYYQDVSSDILSVLEKTSEVYFEVAGEPEIVNEQEIKVNDIVCTADKINVHLDSVSLAKITKSFFSNMVENANIAEMLCRMTGYEEQDELFSDEGYIEFIRNLDDIISGAESNEAAFDMNVYLNGDDIIGREITFSNPAELEMTEDFTNIVFNMYEIPTENGQIITYIDLNTDDEDLTLTLKDVRNGDEHSGSLNFSDYGEGYAVNYDGVTISEELFQGTVKITSVSDPQLAATIRLKTEEKTKLMEITVSDICTIKIALKPSELTLKEFPNPADGEYVDIFSEAENLENSSETMKTLLNDITEYVTKNFIPEDVANENEIGIDQ